MALAILLMCTVPAFADTVCETMSWGDLQTAEVVTAEEAETDMTAATPSEAEYGETALAGAGDEDIHVITTEKKVKAVTPLRPVWLMAHKCNVRGEITGKYGYEDNNVKKSGCNAIEVDIMCEGTTYRSDSVPHEYTGTHAYPANKGEKVFISHSSVDRKKDMTLSELFQDVKEVYPQVTIVYLDIKEPEHMQEINKEVHDCLNYFFGEYDRDRMPHIVYSVPEPEDIFHFRWNAGSFLSPDYQRIDLWENEGVCCDMDSDITKIVNNFKEVGLDKVWVGNGTPLDTWDPIKESGIHKAVSLRDSLNSLSIIKKVEYWTAARQGSVETELIDDDGWRCDSVMIADCVRSSESKMTALLSQINGSDRIRYATLEDDPFKVIKTNYEILFVYYDKNGKKIEELRQYPAGTPYTPPKAPDVPALDYNCVGWKVYNWLGLETVPEYTATGPLIYRMQYTKDPGYKLSFETNGGTCIPDRYVLKSKPNYFDYKPADPEKEGYDFEGWYSDPGFGGFEFFHDPGRRSYEAEGDLTLYARWRKKSYEVGFEVKTDRGTRVRLFSVAYGDLPIPPEDPQKEGYDFVKWEPDITTVRGKQRYTAKFVSKEKVTITFDTMGGTGIDPVTVPKGEIPDLSDIYTERSGYNLVGFFYDKDYAEEFTGYEEPLYESITLYAGWISRTNSAAERFRIIDVKPVIPLPVKPDPGILIPETGDDGGKETVLSAGAGKAEAAPSYSPNWYMDSFGLWRIRNSAGQPVVNAWLCDDAADANGKNVWFLLAQDGAMLAAGLVQDNTGNYYSLETNHDGCFGMLRYTDGYYNCSGQQVYLKFSHEHNGTFGAIQNTDGIEKLKAIYGVTKIGIGNESAVYTKTF